MPALSSAQNHAALIAHSQVDVDSTFGLQVGEDGMILNGLTANPTREKKEKIDHLGRKVMKIFSTPVLALSFEFETTLKAALIPGSTPGTALSMAEVASLNPDTLFGYPTDGFFSVESQSRGGRQGDLYTGSVAGELCYLSTGDTYVFRAAT